MNWAVRCSTTRRVVRPAQWLAAASQAYDALALPASMILLAAMIVLVALQVLSRYVLNHPIPWSEELTSYLFAWLIFLGATVSIKRGNAPALGVVVDCLPAKAARFVRDFAEMLSLAISVLLLVAGARASGELMQQLSPSLQIPMGYPCLALPVAAAGFVLHYLDRAVERMGHGPLGVASVLGAAALAVLALLLPQEWLTQDWPVSVMLGTIVVGFMIGLPVALVLTFGVVAVLLNQQQPLLIIPETMFNASSNFILTAIPFFMFTGAVMEVGGMAERLVGFASSLVGRFRGGLLYTDIVASAIFADMSGSAVSDTAAIGSVMLPGMVRRGYDPAFSTALQAAAGTLGVLFPPSIATIIYAWVANVSVAQMFLASFLPAFLVVLSFAIIAYIVATRHKYPREAASSAREIACALRGTVWALLTPVLILAGILTGAATPTETGVVAALYALAASAGAYRTIDLRNVRQSLEIAVLSTTRVMFVLAAAVLLGWELTLLQVPQSLSTEMLSVSQDPYVLLLLLNVALVLIHGVMETSATLILVVPLVLPIFTQVGIDPIHLGIVFLVNSALGLLTPPLGLVLYVAAPITGLKVETVARAALPFLFALLVDLALVALLPQISTIVPDLLR
jgi:C4-dicarboxylate transporter, DctM subunit